MRDFLKQPFGFADYVGVAFGVLIFVFIYGVMYFGKQEARCLAAGYPTAKIAVTGKAYCTNQLTAVPL